MNVTDRHATFKAHFPFSTLLVLKSGNPLRRGAPVSFHTRTKSFAKSCRCRPNVEDLGPVRSLSSSYVQRSCASAI
ncbi:hypothetical protein SK128_027988, partial [Halocaridina rubra]